MIPIPRKTGSRTMATRHLYQRADCKWAWHLKADNGAIVATDGSQGYENEGDAREMADRVIGGHYSNAKKTIERNANCTRKAS